MKRSGLKSNGFLKRSQLKKIGKKQNEWKEFRNAKFEKEKDEEGLIHCQGTRIGLAECGYSTASPDLHHVIGRDDRPDLYYEGSNLVWLTRSCHERIHNNSSSTSSKA